MENEIDVSAKLWLEDVKLHHATDASIFYSCKKKKIPASLLSQINDFKTKYGITIETIICATWEFFLHHFSSNHHLAYGIANISAKDNKELSLLKKIQEVESVLTEDHTVKQLLLNAKKHLTHKKKLLDDIRYLLAFKSTLPKRKVKTQSLEPSQFPLILCFDATQPDKLELYYHPTLFSTEAVDNIFSHLNLFLREITSDINKLSRDIVLLTEEEEKTLLTSWNKAHTIFNIPTLRQPIHQLFMMHALASPLALAIKHNQTRLSYGEVNDASTSLALALINQQIQKGDRVCVLMERTSTLLISMLALFKIGAIFVPINPKYPDERIEYIISDSNAKRILINHGSYRLAPSHQEKSITLSAHYDPLEYTAFSPDHSQLPAVSLDDIAYILYTSGTTGKPKGVMIAHRGLTNLTAWYQGCLDLNANDHASQFASQGFDTFLCETTPYFASGASVHIVDDNIKLTPAQFFEWLQAENITVCDLPTAYAQVLFTLSWPPTDVRLVKIGGESIKHYPEQAFTFDIWNTYGPTETTIEATYFKIYSANSTPLKIASAPPIGRPIANMEVYLVNHQLQLVPIGVAGELLIGGIGVSEGYVNREELTREKFIPNHFTGQGKLYRTGDLAKWSADGELHFVGRIDHQVKIRGYRIELGDIEHAISQHPDVNEAVVIAKENINGEKSLIAYVVPNLERGRYLYQERCLISTRPNHFMEAVTEDISKNGAALSGISEIIPIGSSLELHVKLPGLTDSKLLHARLIWQKDSRCGVVFDLSAKDQEILAKSIDFYLASHNVMELVLSTAAKRSLRKALKKKLPDYMVPPVFVNLLQFPLTFSGKIDVRALPPPTQFDQILQSEFIPAKTVTEKKLVTIWHTLLQAKTISMTDNFFDLGGNSLSAAELSIHILNEFHQSIPTKILFDLPYIPILAEYIDTHGKNYQSQTSVQDDIERDTQLSDNISPTKKLSASIASPEHILLTGAGGFLGIYLLRELLKSTEAKIYCLIRKGEFETAAKRLMSTVESYHLSEDISLANRRIVAIPSDLSFDNFGLPLEQYNSLVSKVDLIYHCGAQVNTMAAYNKLRGSNVQGTLEIIKFATRQIDKPIHYISTLSSAYRKDESGVLVEAWPDDNYSELIGGYALSKWVSERLLTAVNTRGLPVSIYRSGYISGQSDNGMTNLNDALLLLIKGCIQMGLAPEMNEKITILPVDFVSKAIVNISLHAPAQSEIYHIDHPTGILWTDLIAWLNEYGYKIKLLPMEEWKHHLMLISRDNALFPFLPTYLARENETVIPNVDITHARAVLKTLKLDYPAINDELLTIYFDYLSLINFIPLPQREHRRVEDV